VVQTDGEAARKAQWGGHLPGDTRPTTVIAVQATVIAEQPL